MSEPVKGEAASVQESGTTGHRSVVLVVLDGWGYSSVYEGNAIAQANTQTFDHLWKAYPHTLLQASGEAVGLPWGEIGNSEVGHLNIGAGHIVPQNLPRISAAIADGSFNQNAPLLAACQHAKQTGGALHLVGLASSGGVHSHLRHLIALVRLAATNGVTEVYIHAFTDGRDAPVKAAAGQLAKLQTELDAMGVGRVASVSGRYYAMDRDKHWDRVKLAFEAIVHGEGPSAPSAGELLTSSYEQGLTDEFIIPTAIAAEGQEPARFREADAAIFFNFRQDRARQLTESIVRADFAEFDRGQVPAGMYFVTMTEYEKSLPVHVAWHPQNVEEPLAKVVSEAGLRQFHIAETEKYAHATFFFNGGLEEPYPLEERLLIASPKVATYDQEPTMSAGAITDELEKRIATGDYPLIMVNFANADMVGHSGSFEATIKSVEEIDRCLKRLVTATDQAGTFLLITADHGNAEEMVNFASGDIDTEHTTNPVPFIMVIPEAEMSGFSYDSSKLGFDAKPIPTGLLGDVAPTVLKILQVTPPTAMDGYGLL